MQRNDSAASVGNIISRPEEFEMAAENILATSSSKGQFLCASPFLRKSRV